MRDAVGGRAQQDVAHEMAAVADNAEVVAVGGGVVGDDLGRMAWDEFGAHLDPALLRRGVGLADHACEELFLLALGFIALAQRGGIDAQLALDRQRLRPTRIRTVGLRTEWL
jgi:hypothetical protein